MLTLTLRGRYLSILSLNEQNMIELWHNIFLCVHDKARRRHVLFFANKSYRLWILLAKKGAFSSYFGTLTWKSAALTSILEKNQRRFRRIFCNGRGRYFFCIAWVLVRIMFFIFIYLCIHFYPQGTTTLVASTYHHQILKYLLLGTLIDPLGEKNGKLC